MLLLMVEQVEMGQLQHQRALQSLVVVLADDLVMVVVVFLVVAVLVVPVQTTW